jgi:cyclophilin family peptidyl-prolyl cis-trans isomerase
MRLMIVIAVAGALLLAACGGDSKTSSGKTAVASPAAAKPTAASGAPTARATAPAAASTPGSQPTQNGGHKTYSAPPPMTIDPNKRYFATIKMEIGDIKLELYPKNAPVSVNNFVFLARDHYYDGVTFHRVIPGFVAQAGDPTGTGSGGPGYTIKDEVNSAKFLDGTIGMAKTAAPNSAGSQWFIDYAPQPALDGGYTTFGQLIEGRDVLDKIAPRDPQRATAPGTKINTIVIDEQ